MRAAVLLLAAALAVAAEPVEVTTEHYSISADGIDANEAGRVLEALHRRLAEYFGKTPPGVLRVEVFATVDAFHAALRRDRQAEVQAGGYYAPDTKTAYLFVQPSEYFTRQLLLHEATHQFHFLVATGNRLPACGWYTEGIAEYFGMHDWDGASLDVGAIPALSLEDYPAAARKQFVDAGRDIEAIATGGKPCDRPLAWALFHFLRNRYPKPFAALSARLDAGAKPEEAWRAEFDGLPALTREFETWVEFHQQPFRIEWISWQERGAQVEGKAAVVSAAFFKEAPLSFEAEMELVSGTMKAGIAFNEVSKDDYCLFQVLPGAARVVRRSEGAWKVLASAPLPDRDGPPVVSYLLESGEAVLSANGREVYRAKAAGDVGLNVEGCCVRFRLRK